jgi:hypothetical protein
MLDGMDRTSPLILGTKTGRSSKKRYFIALWTRVAKRAGLDSIALPDFSGPALRCIFMICAGQP